MNALKDLTKQESIIFTLVAQGQRNAEIAQKLYISIRTVETHVYHIFQKLNISTRTEAVVYAFESGLLLQSEFSGNMSDAENRSTYYNVMS